MLVWIVKNWKIVSLGLLVLAAISVLWYMRHTAYNEGYAKAVAEYEAAKTSAIKKAQKKIATEVNQNDKNAKENVYNAPDTCLARVGAAVDSMQQPSNNR